MATEKHRGGLSSSALQGYIVNIFIDLFPYFHRVLHVHPLAYRNTHIYRYRFVKDVVTRCPVVTGQKLRKNH